MCVCAFLNHCIVLSFIAVTSWVEKKKKFCVGRSFSFVFFFLWEVWSLLSLSSKIRLMARKKVPEQPE